MRTKHIFKIIIMSLVLINGCKMENKQTLTKNPLFSENNAIIDFESLAADFIKEATDSIIAEFNEKLKIIYAIEAKERTFENSIRHFDILYDKLNNLHSLIYLMAYVHPDSAIRNQSNECVTQLSKYINEITLDENLYNVFVEYSKNNESKTIDERFKRLIKEQIADFNRNGFKLPVEKRNELRKMKDKISDLSLEFSTNINSFSDELIISEDDTAGLPKDFLEPRKQDDGTYKIDLSYPSYRPFMKYAKNEENRKKLLFKYLNRAADKNMDLLQDLLKERKKMSNLLGYNSYAEYSLENKMAKVPEIVWQFENSLIEKVKVKGQNDYNELLEIKEQVTGKKEVQINSWEAGYYDNILLKQKYELDQEKLKEYFPLENVLEGIFEISQKLFNLEFKEIDNPSVWHTDVKMFEVKSENKPAGYFYLDLYPRENKYNHAACFSLANGVKNKQLEKIPTATLVCNFPKPTTERPSLIMHSDVVTMFHEFGHLLHHLLAVTPVSMQSSISNSRDFVEVPSQFFENWAWSYESLILFAKHYRTNEPLPKELHDKMIASKNVGSGIATLQQIFYGTLDMTLHDRYDPDGKETTTDIVKKLQNEITLYPYVENTHFHAAFGHLTNYAAGYYGYLWAKVFAEDCFSIFEEKGILNEMAGERFKNEILTKGSSKDEMEMIKAFLQREPNDKAFVKSLGL